MAGQHSTLAAQEGHLEIVEKLIEKGAKLEEADKVWLDSVTRSCIQRSSRTL